MIFTILEASKAQVKTLQNHDVIRLIYEKLDLDDWLLAHLFFYDKDGKRYIGVELSEVE